MKTKDFEKFSYPYRLIDVGYEIIDSNITNINGKYTMFFKDERETEKTIKRAISNDMVNWHIEDYIYNLDNQEAEGPFVLETLEEKNYLFADNYREGHIQCGEIATSGYVTNTQPIINNHISQLGEVRHFSIIKITEEEYNKLIEYYKR